MFGRRLLNPCTLPSAVVATCNQDVKNNITYFISPNFPTLMSSNMKACKLKIKMMSSDISQLRFDFVHFSIVSRTMYSDFYFFFPCRWYALLILTEFDFIRLDKWKGQPNRQNGNCDGDVFLVSGGASGDFHLCGYNNGQHSERTQQIWCPSGAFVPCISTYFCAFVL